MKKKIESIIKTKHLFLYLLPIFFIFHRFIQNYDLISITDALYILAAYIIAAFIISIIGSWFFKSRYKACLFGFALLFINFFFGVLWDWLNEIGQNTILTYYSFQFSAIFILIVIIFIVLKRKKTISLRMGEVLNIFFLLLLLVDVGWLVLRITTKNNEIHFQDEITLTPFTGNTKPDIYLIVADEYAGKNELKDIFEFDNSGFENELSQRGFHTIQNSTSNYPFTILSMASTLNMAYLKLHNTNLKSNITKALVGIKKASAITFFKKIGYRFNNLSIFQSDDIQNDQNAHYLFSGKQLLTSPTLLYHLLIELHYKLVVKRKIKSLDNGVTYQIQKSNDSIYQNTIELSKTKSNHPFFIYTHLVLPHFLYYFDRNGKPAPFEKLLGNDRSFSKKNYLEYLQYANKKFITLIDEIQKNSASPPIIILMSDHGFRELNDRVDKKYQFSNLISICIPGTDYSEFYDGMSIVNFFRVFLNTQFGQTLPLLKDSTVFLQQ
ncbi:MAG: sulfatase-like hydrolase/transferase [Bacteroidota bacterium]